MIMANRKELPREKKLKAAISELKSQLETLNINYEVEVSTNRELVKQLEIERKHKEELCEESQYLFKRIKRYDGEFERKQKLIDFLIDSKL